MWTFRNQPAGSHLLDKLDALTAGTLPRSYLQFLTSFDGGQAEIDITPYVIHLFSVETVIDLAEAKGEFDLPGLIRIGSNRASESIVFDTRKPGPYVSALDNYSDYAGLMLIAETFEKLLELCDAPNQDEGEDLAETSECAAEELRASRLVCFKLWGLKDRDYNCKRLEIDKYAREFVAFGGSGNNFLGIDKRDGSIWSANVLGSKHLGATKLADSFTEIDKLIEIRKKMWPGIRDNLNRYYEQWSVVCADDLELQSFERTWARELKPWLQRTFVVEKPYCDLCIYFIAEHAVVPTIVRTDNGCGVATAPVQTFDYREKGELLRVVEAAIEAGIPEPQVFDKEQLIYDEFGETAFESVDLVKQHFGVTNWSELEKRSIRLSLRCYPSGWLVSCTGRSADRTWTQKDWFDVRLSIDVANVQEVVDLTFEYLTARRDLAGFMSRQSI